MQDPLLVAVLASAVVLVAAVALVIWIRRKHAGRVERLEQRATAELDRVQTEHDKQVDRLTREWKGERKRAHLDLARDLLPALDAVESALESADDGDEVTRGLEMVRREILEAFRAHDIERIAPAPGDAFDPEIHEAIEVAEPTDEAPNGTVQACHRAGYRHPEAVLRPAMVGVSRA
jgi:molecular chaperone GrpE